MAQPKVIYYLGDTIEELLKNYQRINVKIEFAKEDSRTDPHMLWGQYEINGQKYSEGISLEERKGGNLMEMLREHVIGVADSLSKKGFKVKFDPNNKHKLVIIR